MIRLTSWSGCKLHNYLPLLLVYYVTHRLSLYLTRLDWTSCWWWPPNVWAMGSGCSSSQPWWDIRRMHAQLGDRCGTWASATVAAQSGGGPAPRVWGHPASYSGHPRKPAKRTCSARLIIGQRSFSRPHDSVFWEDQLIVVQCSAASDSQLRKGRGGSWSVKWNQSSAALINNVICPRICVSSPLNHRYSSVINGNYIWA